MTASILVAYATKYGSTREVAEAIAETIREHDLIAIVEAASEVQSLDGFEAVVLGAPLYIGHLLSDAGQFIERHREALTRVPVAVFALGPLTISDDEARGSQDQLDAELARYPWLSPVATAMFGGRYDPERLSLMHKMMAKMPGTPLYGREASDIRDWDAIHAWAAALPARLHALVPA
jgi:menaquinone-dependent protoporphyrinogen oxidase